MIKFPLPLVLFQISLFLFPQTEQKDLICNLPFLFLTIFTFLLSVIFFTAYTICFTIVSVKKINYQLLMQKKTTEANHQLYKVWFNHCCLFLLKQHY